MAPAGTPTAAARHSYRTQPDLMRNRILVGGSWLIAAQVFERVFGVASIAVLARLLTPADFGTVAVAATVVAAVELLSTFGFDWALVRHKEPSNDYLNTAWTLRVLLGLATFTVLGILGPIAATFYRLPPLKYVLLVLGLASFLGSLENIGTVYFRREFQFHREFLLRAISKLSGFFVTVLLALHYRSYWALVVGMLVMRSSNTVASYVLQHYRPRFSLTSSRELLGFSSWLLIGNVVDYCREKFSDLYLGRVYGPKAIGLFSIAGELSRIPISEVAAPINRVAYSKYAEDLRANRGVADSYLEIASLIWMISLPMCAGTFAVAPEIVALLLGPKWKEAETIIRLLTIGSAFTGMTANTHYVYWAVGHSRAVAALSAVGAAIVIPATIVCSHLAGYQGVAVASAFTSAALVPVNFALLKRLAGVGFADLWRKTWRVTLSAIAMLGTLMIVIPQPPLETIPQAAGVLAIKIILGVATYVASTTALWMACRKPLGPEWRVLQLAHRWLKR
jgi:lipopolysaccharide exporter